MNQLYNLKMFENLFECSPDACLLIENNLFVKCNQAAIAMLRADTKEQIFNTHPSVLSPTVQPDGQTSYEKAEKLLASVVDKGSLHFEWMHKRLDGEKFPVDVSLTLIRDSDKVVIYTVWRDISVRKQAEEKVRLMSKVFEHSGEAVVITGPNNKILVTNKSFTRMTGYSQEDVLGQNPSILQSGKELNGFYTAMWESLLKENFWQGELWDKRKDGSLYLKWLAISVVRDNLNEITNYIGSFTDITEWKQAAQKIEDLVHHDSLTNLPNRFSLMERLSQALVLAKRSRTHLAVMFINLDRFKNVNDLLGHHIADSLLLDVAKRLLASVRSADIVARVGGDEFVVVLSQIQSEITAAHIVNKIHLALSQTYLLAGHDLHITSCIGVSVFPHDGEAAEELIENSDFAMSHAKSQGRNNYQFFKQEMNSVVRERLLLENDLRVAVKQEEFLLHYQPQIDMASGRVVGVEALVRWQHPERGMIPPDMFIPMAEETGLILPLGDWVLRAACWQLMDWLSEGLPPLRMAVNLSARQFKQENLPDLVAGIIAEIGIDSHLLELEITESAAMDNLDTTILHLNRLRDMGVELAIDDFGTGYSSLSYLKRFPANRLKIDRSFVMGIETDSDDAAIAAATIALAHKLGKEVIAEGVETEAQLSFLRDQQCDIIQGYFFSRPLPAKETSLFIRHNHIERGSCTPSEQDDGRNVVAPVGGVGQNAAPS